MWMNRLEGQAPESSRKLVLDWSEEKSAVRHMAFKDYCLFFPIIS